MLRRSGAIIRCLIGVIFRHSPAAMRFLTDFADLAVVLPVVLAIAIVLVLQGWRRGALVWLGALESYLRTGRRWPLLAHYLVVGDGHNLSPHPLLDAPAYRGRPVPAHRPVVPARPGAGNVR